MNFPQRKLRDQTITLAHGSGGKAMHELIDALFISHFSNPQLTPLEDQARIDLESLSSCGQQLAFTTDSYVVDPLFFPGGDIGALAVNGTVNDLAMSGAKPLYLSCAVIIEEGLETAILLRIVQSMQAAASAAGVRVVTGDTKVVPRGAADKLFINTAGVGVIPAGVDIRATRAQAGDVVIVSGYLGDHGAAILDARGELALENTIVSDCQPLHDLVATVLARGVDIHCLRDATRGGLATVLNEFARSSNCAVQIDESVLPVREAVRGFCEILGLDPLYLANEGKLVAVVAPAQAEAALSAMNEHPAGQDAVIIGRIDTTPTGTVIMNTAFGGERVVDMLIGDQLPRIC